MPTIRPRKQAAPKKRDSPFEKALVAELLGEEVAMIGNAALVAVLLPPVVALAIAVVTVAVPGGTLRF